MVIYPASSCNRHKRNERLDKMKKNKKYMVISAISMICFFVLWELVTDVFHLFPVYSMPSPIKTFQAFFIKLVNPSPDGSVLLVHVAASLQVALTGYVLGAIVGIPLGILMAWYKPVDLFVKPIFDLIRPIPPIGWVPIMILLLGIDLKSKAMVIFVSAVIPCIINSYSGIKQTSEVHINVGKTFGLTKFEILRKIAIPTALPMIFTGLRVSLGVAWMTLVAAELVAATKGLGYMLQIARTIGRPDIIVMGMLVIAGVGAILTGTLEFLEKKFVRR
ncbi:ABC transporter permease subunit [Faecalicatena orotica]|jgi:ABC-type nitrate/sulfonate/bicarbonate transport system permease component|uniref:NitT/TauT family transport system permease protein/taurine transport system permease protein n=2 Tax=Bacillota TaxID=1239 RepID=A0A2Y9BL22_9FIRM|nr:NitT/TauT family transport system permease protein/taurine transport system permease protein [Faecalicatena orotica]SSA57579.1 NitT/TauT family transport system permease protein/taurine transport system permease protein [Faecalicatena orotica]